MVVNYCKCGCGNILKEGMYKRKIREYIHGHNTKGRKMSEQHKRKIGDAQKGEKNHMYGKHTSEYQKQRVRESMEERKEKYGYINSPSARKKTSERMKGTKGYVYGKRSGEIKECEICKKEFYCYPYEIENRRVCSNKCSYKLPRQPSWNKGKKWNKYHKKRLRLSHLGIKASKQTREKMRISKLKYISKIHFNGEPPIPCIGRYEKPILDTLEKSLGYNILRQHQISGFFLDGYCPSLNLAIEIDEPHHKNLYYKKKDINKEEIIKERLSCSFLRIPLK